MRLHGPEIRESVLKPHGKVKKARSKIGRADWTEISLAFRPPYDWQTIMRFYLTHPIPGVERVTEDSFERIFRVGDTIGFLQVRAMVAELGSL
jgi:AraC family transcriptional regulator of adaptative response / DNA-3-methyladenine glycosylase II